MAGVRAADTHDAPVTEVTSTTIAATDTTRRRGHRRIRRNDLRVIIFSPSSEKYDNLTQ